MGMRVDYSNNKYGVYFRQQNKCVRTKTKFESIKLAIRAARNQTGRENIIAVLPPGSSTKGLDDPYCKIISNNNLSEFCRSLAVSESRIAGVLVIPDEKNIKYKGFLRKVRELTSAEGAVLIWDDSKSQRDRSQDPISNGFFGIHPDITFWALEEPG